MINPFEFSALILHAFVGQIDYHIAEKLFADYFDNHRAVFAYSYGSQGDPEWRSAIHETCEAMGLIRRTPNGRVERASLCNS